MLLQLGDRLAAYTAFRLVANSGTRSVKCNAIAGYNVDDCVVLKRLG